MKVRRFYPVQVVREVLIKESKLTRAENAVHSYAESGQKRSVFELAHADLEITLAAGLYGVAV